MDYLRKIGVVAKEDENAIFALYRHAEEYNWKKNTRNKHLKIVRLSVAVSVEQKLENLKYLNDILAELCMPEEYSIRQAKKAIRRININIYDFEAGVLKIHKSLGDLRFYSRKNKLVYPKKLAKENGYKVFLKKLF